jgi:hypothetical protein
MTPEARVKQGVIKLLKELGAWYYMPVPNGYSKMGVPDFLICYKGVFIAVETKAPGKKNNTSPMQRREIAAINTAGGFAVVIDNADDLRTYLEAVM